MRIPLISAFFLFVCSFLLDWYIASDVKNSFRRRGALTVWWISAFLCWCFLIVIFCMPRRSSQAGIGPVMWMLFAYISIYIGKLGYFLCSVFGRLGTIGKNKRRRYRRRGEVVHPARWGGIIVGALLCGMMWIGAAHTRHQIMVIHEEITDSRIPKGFDGYRIVQISDLHVGTWGKDTTFISKFVDSVNNLKPDIILFTGDIVNRQTPELIPFIPVLSRLKAPDGVYSILGNHDYGDYVNWENPQQRLENNALLKKYQKQMGWKMLNNRHDQIIAGNDTLMLIGVENIGDPPFPTYGDLNVALKQNVNSGESGLSDNKFKILMSHNPIHWDEEVAENTDILLTLSGHTHAMQAMVQIGDWKWSPAKYRYEQWGGKYERENNNGLPSYLYVNIGAGEVGVPARFLSAYPEITEIVLRSE